MEGFNLDQCGYPGHRSSAAHFKVKYQNAEDACQSTRSLTALKNA